MMLAWHEVPKRPRFPSVEEIVDFNESSVILSFCVFFELEIAIFGFFPRAQLIFLAHALDEPISIREPAAPEARARRRLPPKGRGSSKRGVEPFFPLPHPTRARVDLPPLRS